MLKLVIHFGLISLVSAALVAVVTPVNSVNYRWVSDECCEQRWACQHERWRPWHRTNVAPHSHRPSYRSSHPSQPEHSTQHSAVSDHQLSRKSAQVVNSNLACDPTIWQPGFDLPRQQWSLLNRFRTEQGQCITCRRKWRLTDTDLCPCGETQTMSHIVESRPLTKLNGGLSQLNSADEVAVSQLTNYG